MNSTHYKVWNNLVGHVGASRRKASNWARMGVFASERRRGSAWLWSQKSGVGLLQAFSSAGQSARQQHCARRCRRTALTCISPTQEFFRAYFSTSIPCTAAIAGSLGVNQQISFGARKTCIGRCAIKPVSANGGLDLLRYVLLALRCAEARRVIENARGARA